jgi:hypothetical protein
MGRKFLKEAPRAQTAFYVCTIALKRTLGDSKGFVQKNRSNGNIPHRKVPTKGDFMEKGTALFMRFGAECISL